MVGRYRLIILFSFIALLTSFQGVSPAPGNTQLEQEMSNLKWTIFWTALFVILGFIAFVLALLRYIRNMRDRSALENKHLVDRFSGELEILQNQLIELREKRGIMPTEKAEELVKKLIMLVESEVLYKDPEVSLEQLADRLDVNRTYLSHAINSLWGNNLNDFINYFRIKEARGLLLKAAAQNKNLLTVAYEVGFNSKSTFNRVFKEKTGLTPGQYIQIRQS